MSASAAGNPPPARTRTWPRLKSAILPGGLAILALFLRTYRLRLISINFDTYEQLTSTKRLLAGDFPISNIYPPGIAVIMAAPMAIFSPTLATMQAVIVTCSVALVVLSYVATRKLTGDALGATLFSLAVAGSPLMVYYSRVALFDVINALCIASAIFLVPALRGRPLVVSFLYGVLLAIVVNIRTTNVVLLPAVAILWLDGGAHRPTLRSLRVAFWRHEPVVALVSLALGATALALITGSTRQASHAPFVFHGYGQRILVYELFTFSDLAVLLVLPLAILGAKHLWRENASTVLVAGYMIVVWPFAHAPFAFFESRYMIPALYFALLLAAHGAGNAFRQSSGRARMRILCLTVFAIFVGYQSVYDAVLLTNWPSRASRGSEAIYRELRPRIRQIPDRSLLISAHTRGVRDTNGRIEYLDLIDQSIPDGNEPSNVEAVLDTAAQAQSDGRETYYLYSDFEAEQLKIGLPGPSYAVYFEAVERRFEVEEIYRTSDEDFRIYRIGTAR